jgi:cell division septation protein DedD
MGEYICNNFVHCVKIEQKEMKYLSHFLVMAISCFSMVLTGQDVEITINHPSQVRAGEDFLVTVTIQKGDLTDYSRFSQDLPLGLTATNVSSPNADFSFDNQRIRVIWLKLPDNPEVSVSYRVQVNERLKGTFMMGGVFAYVVDDERKFLNVNDGREITIIPSSTVDPDFIVDIKDFKGASAAPATEDPQDKAFAMAIRQKPILLPSGGYLVRLLVNNPTGSKYAKIEETLPSGYAFEEVDNQGGIVSYAASTVKFIWMKLPETSEFELEYKLIPKQNEPQGEVHINGMLTYTSGNENRLVQVKELDVPLEVLSPAEKRNLLLTGEAPGSVRRTQAVTQGQVREPTRTEGGESTPVRTGTTTQTTGQTTTQSAAQSATRTTTPAATVAGTIMNTRVLAAESGVYYRVQIAATAEASDARTLFREAGVDREVFVEQEGGFFKYTVGSFRTYDEALSYRNQVENLPEVEGSFVVAYRDGKRIPIASVRQ